MNITLLLTVYTHCLKFIPKTPTVHLIALPTHSFHNIASDSFSLLEYFTYVLDDQPAFAQRNVDTDLPKASSSHCSLRQNRIGKGSP